MIIVAGGAGFVGSHVSKLLRSEGLDHFILDDFSGGHRGAAGASRLVECDLRDGGAVDRALGSNPGDSLILLAGSISVGESVRDPGLYYANNVLGGMNVLEGARRFGIGKVVFSSSAAVYGEAKSFPIAEDHATHPTNAYGETKLAIERMLFWYGRGYGLRSVCLRYFNAAGCDADGELGEAHDPEEHLLPLAIDACLGRRDPLTVYGGDYDTRDGTCIRDYVHVWDLARAHVMALDYLSGVADGSWDAINLGTGTGHSVLEVLESVGRISGRSVPFEMGARRAGDPARLVASNSKALEVLGWRPEYGLDDMVAHALRWREAHPFGYG